MVEDDFSRLISCLIQNYYLSLQRQRIKIKKHEKKDSGVCDIYLFSIFLPAIEKHRSGESGRLGIDPCGLNGEDRTPAKRAYLLYQA